MWSDNLDDALFEAAKAVDMTLQDQGVKHEVRARRLYADKWELLINRYRNGRFFGVRIVRIGEDGHVSDPTFYASTGNWPEGWRVDRDTLEVRS